MTSQLDMAGTEGAPAVTALRLVFCDLSGIRRCRIAPVSNSHVYECGVGIAGCCIGFPTYGDVAPSEGPLGVVGDCRLTPDMSTEQTLPWHPNHKWFMCNWNRSPGVTSGTCPRGALRLALEALKSEFDYELKVGFETEFVLIDLKTGNPVDSSAYCYVDDTNAIAHVLDEMVEMLGKMNIAVSQFHLESAPAQAEIVTGPMSPMEAADKLILTREAIAAVARKHGMRPSFLPKYFPEQAGSGAHCHFSLTKNGENIMQGEEVETLSTPAQHFMAGILEHLSSVVCFTSPSPNSYERLSPQTWSGGHKVWGVFNKEAPLRMVYPPKEIKGATNCELKSFDATANPHLGIAAMVLAGIIGLRSQIPLPPPVQVDPMSLTPEERESAGIERLPESLSQALECLENDQALKEEFAKVIGLDILDAHVAARRMDAKFFAGKSLEEQVSILRFKF